MTSSEPPIAPPPGSDVPFGLFGFRLTGIAPNSTHDVTIYLPSLVGVAGYLKYLPDTVSWAAMPGDRVVGDTWRRAIVVTLTDGGIGDGDGLANGVIVDPGGPFTGPTGGGDTNADGIPDALQPAGTPEFAFSDTTTNPPTYGRLVNANGLAGRIADAADQEKGVLVTVDPRTGGGSGQRTRGVRVNRPDRPGQPGRPDLRERDRQPDHRLATVVLDNDDTVTVPAGSSAEIEDTTEGVTLTNVTGGAVTVTSLNASTLVVLDNDDTVTVPPGSSAEIEDTTDGVTLTNVTGGGVTVTVNGNAITMQWRRGVHGQQVGVHRFRRPGRQDTGPQLREGRARGAAEMAPR